MTNHLLLGDPEPAPDVIVRRQPVGTVRGDLRPSRREGPLRTVLNDEEVVHMERPLYHYEYVDEPFDDIIQLLADRAPEVLQTATEVAAAHAREVVATVHVPVGRFEIGRQIIIDVGDYVPRELRTGYVPISWQAEEHAQLFPRVEGKLEVGALSIDPPVTQVSLVGTYAPPLGALGAVADDVVGHRVAEAAVHRFVKDVVHRIREELAEDRSSEPEFSMLDY